MSSTDTIPSFSQLGLADELAAEVAALGYERPTPVQSGSIPALLSGRDLIGQAQTGTGKTAAFALPLLSRIDFDVAGPQVLVLTPTRELAIQVAEAFKSYARRYKKFQVLPLYGGQSMGMQLQHLARKPHVIVGTPGRVMDHLRRKSLALSTLRSIVIDEADEMLSMGFIEDIQWILEQAPSEKQVALFSATMPKAIRAIAQKHLKDPEEVVVRQVVSDAPLITQSHWVVSYQHKLDALTRILEVSDADGVLIFMRTKTATLELSEKLEARGYRAGALNGDMSQEARERTVQRFKAGRLDVLIATDVAARGLHIDRISHVINYDAPFDLATYTHRIGRTGRAGRSGNAILFVTPREMGLLRSLERGMGTRIGRFQMPTREDLGRRRIDRLIERLRSAVQRTDLPEYARVVSLAAEQSALPIEQIAAGLCALLHAESPLLVEERELAGAQSKSDELPRRPRQGWKCTAQRGAASGQKWRRGSGRSTANPPVKPHRKGTSAPRGKGAARTGARRDRS